ncbi:MAG: hypothetical protein HY079_05585 [Elusimicrobia bacterium]|nr:hypothetical protein [Elusimicrobiota bacterium]
MNIMIAAVGLESGHAALGGTAEGALFVAVMAAVGFLFLMAGGRLLKSFHEPHAARYTGPRF